MPDPSRPTSTADPTALPTFASTVTLDPPTGSRHGGALKATGSWQPDGGFGVDDGVGVAGGVDFEVVDQLRARVASRLASGESGQFSGLDAEGKVEFIRALAVEELRAFVLHRQMLGQPVPSEVVEDAIIEAVVAATGGLGRLEPLLRRADVEDIFFSGTAPTVLRLADGSKVTGPPIAGSDEDLLALLRGLSSSIGDGAVRELSPAQPLLALRLKSVGDLGAGCRRRSM